jgi:drug/metabolite transporter (DMT)-like permease
MTAADPMAAARRNQVPRGILYMVASTVMFAGVNAIVKWELATYPVGEVAFFRSLFAFATVALLILPRSGWGVLRTRRYREHLQRGLSQFGSMTCMMLAFSMLPLASAIAIGFSAPLFTTLLSVVVLKEIVGVHRWSALVVGFIGVLVVTHPGADTLSWGAFFALANAVLISSVAIAIRRMSATESTETLILYQMSVITVCTLFLLPFGYIQPAWYDVLALAAAGAGNGIAQFWWTRALSVAPPSAVVPFNYLSLVWAAMLGFAIWGDVPTAELLAGSGIVIASGLYILWRETVRRRRSPPEPAVIPAQAGIQGGESPSRSPGPPLSRG